MKHNPRTIDDQDSIPSFDQSTWPWIDASDSLPSLMEDGSEWPRISIVTPSYNQGHFIEETIRSVLLQGYPNLEYIIIDGGSTDNSVEIIKKYESHLSYWTSEKDSGQSGAINRGLDLATGKWFNWLNSDDILLQNSLVTLAKIINLDNNINWISGGRLLLSKNGEIIDQYLPWRSNPLILGLDYPALFPQEATFFRLDWVRSHDIKIREDLHNAMDTYLYFQLMSHDRPLLTTAVFSAMRLHEAQKGGQLKNLNKEIKQAIDPLWRTTNPQSYFIFKLMHLRFGVGTIFRLFLRLILQYRLHHNLGNWQLAIFNVLQQRWQIVPATSKIDWV
jgi:glycosyltransferase involved in cell wall biosynthesis